MPIKELKDELRAMRRTHCPPVSKMKKSDIEREIQRLQEQRPSHYEAPQVERRPRVVKPKKETKEMEVQTEEPEVKEKETMAEKMARLRAMRKIGGAVKKHVEAKKETKKKIAEEAVKKVEKKKEKKETEMMGEEDTLASKKREFEKMMKAKETEEERPRRRKVKIVEVESEEEEKPKEKKSLTSEFSKKIADKFDFDEGDVLPFVDNTLRVINALEDFGVKEYTPEQLKKMEESANRAYDKYLKSEKDKEKVKKFLLDMIKKRKTKKQEQPPKMRRRKVKTEPEVKKQVEEETTQEVTLPTKYIRGGKRTMNVKI